MLHDLSNVTRTRSHHHQSTKCRSLAKLTFLCIIFLGNNNLDNMKALFNPENAVDANVGLGKNNNYEWITDKDK